jgi:hypothetical protein
MSDSSSGYFGRIGGFRPGLGAPRRAGGPIPGGPAALGMPGAGGYIPNYARFDPFDVNSAEGFEIVRQNTGLQQPIRMPVREWTPDTGPTVVPGSWSGEKQLSIPGIPTRNMPGRSYTPGNEAPARPKRSEALQNAVLGRAETAELVDPALLGGAMNRWDPDGEFAKDVQNPEIPAEWIAAGYQVPVGVVERLRGLGLRRDGRFPETVTDPGTVRRDVLRLEVGDPAVAGEYLDLLDPAERSPIRGGAPYAGDPIDYATGLPSDVPIALRGRSGGLRAENIALGADRGGFASIDPASVSLRARRSGGDQAPFQTVDVVMANGDGTFSVQKFDPTTAVRQRTLDPDSTAPFGRSEDQSMGSAVQEVMNEAKTPVMTRSALLAAREAGRFRPLPLDQREGSLVGYITQAGADAPLPVYAPMEEGRPLMTAGEAPEQLYRIGNPLNRNDVAVRAGLSELTGLAPVWGTRPQRHRPVSKGALVEQMQRGYTVAPGADPDAVLAPEALVAQLNALRGVTAEDARSSMGQLVVGTGPELAATIRGGAEGVGPFRNAGYYAEQAFGVPRSTLVPEVDQATGRATGRLLPMERTQAGPAMLLSDTLARIKGEEFGERRGNMFGRVGLEREAGALGKGAYVAATPTVDGIQRVIAPMITSGRLTAEAIQGDPQMARLFAPGSQARELLNQAVVGATNGRMRMNWTDQPVAVTPMGRVMPDPMEPQGPASAYYPGGVAQAPLQQEAAARVLANPESRQLQIMRAFRDPEGGHIGVRPMTGEFQYAPSEAYDAALAKLSSRAPAVAIRDRTPAQQLELGLAGATARGGQMELPIALPQGAEPSWGTRVAQGLEQTYARDAFGYSMNAARPLPSTAIADGSGSVHVLSPIRAVDQPGLPFRDIDTEPRVLAEGLVGTVPGPYAGASYYNTPLDRSQYQGSMSGRGDFDYAAMADQVGAEDVGSREQSRAMAQLAARQRARLAQASLAAPVAPSGPSYGQLSLFGY